VDPSKRTDEANMDLEQVGMIDVDVDIAVHEGGIGGEGEDVDVDLALERSGYAYENERVLIDR